MVQLIKPQLEELLLNQFFHSDLMGKYLVACIVADAEEIEEEKVKLEKKFFGERLEVLNELVRTTTDLNCFIKIKKRNGQIERIKMLAIMQELKKFEMFLTHKIVEHSRIKL